MAMLIIKYIILIIYSVRLSIIQRRKRWSKVHGEYEENKSSRGGPVGGGSNEELEDGDGKESDTVKSYLIQALIIMTDRWISRTAMC